METVTVNEIFCGRRWAMLAGKEILEMFRRLWLMPVILIVLYLIDILLHTSTGLQFNGISIIAGIFVWMIPSQLYSQVNDRQKGVSYMLLPASTLEKFLSMFVVAVLIGPMILGATSIIMESVTSWIYSRLNPAEVFVFPDLRELAESLLIMIVTQSGFIFGNLYFKKNKVFNTLLLVTALHGLLLMTGLLVLDLCFEGTGVGQLFDNPDDIPDILITLGEVARYLYTIGMPLAFYLASYLRIRKMEYR